MNTNSKYSIAIISVFLWIGFVCAISFMEAWLKFSAPGVTIPIGLGIGRLVFGALNKIEWVFTVGIALNLMLTKTPLLTARNVFYLVPVALLVLQTFLLLPFLDIRAEQLIQGEELPSSNVHFYYVGMEVLKIICLFIFGIKILGLNGKFETDRAD